MENCVWLFPSSPTLFSLSVLLTVAANLLFHSIALKKKVLQGVCVWKAEPFL